MVRRNTTSLIAHHNAEMSPKSPTKVSPEQTLESKDNGELMAQPKKDMIVEFNGGSEKAKIRTRDGGLNGEDKDLCHKGMLTFLYIIYLSTSF